MRRKKAEKLTRQHIEDMHASMFMGFMIDRPDTLEKNVKIFLDTLERIGIIKPDRPEAG